MHRKSCNPRRFWVLAIFHRDFPRRKSIKITMETDPESRKKIMVFHRTLNTLKAAPRLVCSHFPFRYFLATKFTMEKARVQNGTSCRTAI